MEKRVLLALSLSFLILGFYPMALRYFYPHYGQVRTAPAVSVTPIAGKAPAVKSTEKPAAVKTRTKPAASNKAAGGNNQ